MDRTINHESEKGLSLLEVMIAALVICVSLMAIAMTMVQGVSAVYYTQQQLIAKQKAREALESVFTARNTQGIAFEQIQNDTVMGGIFLTDFQPIHAMGDDGIANTADDDGEPIEEMSFPGPDGLLGTADDEILPLNNYERKITIRDVLDTDGDVDNDIREMTVEVRFKASNGWRTVTVSSFVSRFA